ncbi:response regulator transcription factor [Synechocystis sp. FACHB-383]|uniref:response regulator transcription factor n=1 Tax=Synechocystis sp. FACHB-383 TaxID=2692864 RepID=UPI0018EF9F1B|nr:response regulator transcription factor [Synechocystis sp. FACHB-383]
MLVKQHLVGFPMATLEAPPHSLQHQEIPPSHRILVVEDEVSIRETIVLSLQEEGYEVYAVDDGRDALALLQEFSEDPGQAAVDLIILDIMLPQVNGLDVCRSLRFGGDNTPILIVSAKGSEMEKVTGLEVGADDYITKPFSMRELVARCRAMIRRQGLAGNSIAPFRKFRDLVLYPQECRVLMRGEEVNLAPKEFRLLELFMSYPRRVWSREQLIEHIWGIDFMGDSKTVDVHIRWLREKLEQDPSQPEYLVTVRGFGYRFG